MTEQIDKLDREWLMTAKWSKSPDLSQLHCRAVRTSLIQLFSFTRRLDK
jgi:hypothetical protein